MVERIAVGVIGATGNTGKTVVAGLLASSTTFDVTSFTRKASASNDANRKFQQQGVRVVGYDLAGPQQELVNELRAIDVLISCITWEHLEQQLVWIEAAKTADVKRFVPSEWVGPVPKGIVDIKDKKIDILGAIQRAHLPYTVIDVGAWAQVFVPKVPSGRSDHAHSMYIDHRIVGDGTQKFAITGQMDIGRYVAQIVADPRTLNRHVFAYTETVSMNEIWDTMAAVSGETPQKGYVSEEELRAIIAQCGERLRRSSEAAHHPSNILDTANYNMGQYRISWCIRGDNTPDYADYLGYQDFWKLYPGFPKGETLQDFFKIVLEKGAI